MSDSRSQDLNRLMGMHSDDAGNEGTHFHRTITSFLDSSSNISSVAASNPMPVLSLSKLSDAVVDGEAYQLNSVTTLANAAVFDIGLDIPAGTTRVAILLTFAGSGSLDVDMYEGSTYTGGASTTPRNLDRDAGDSSLVTTVTGPSVSALGTLIAEASLDRGTKSTFGIGAVGFILKVSTKYVVRLTSTSSNNTINTNLIWIERSPD